MVGLLYNIIFHITSHLHFIILIFHYYHCLVILYGIDIITLHCIYMITLLCFELGLDSCYMDGLKDTIGGEFIIALAFTFTIYLFICRCTCWLRWYRFIYLLSSGVQKFIYNRSFVYSSHPQSRNELIKLPVFEIKCKAMMGICIYWISRHVIFGKRCKYSYRWGLSTKEWVIFYN